MLHVGKFEREEDLLRLIHHGVFTSEVYAKVSHDESKKSALTFRVENSASFFAINRETLSVLAAQIAFLQRRMQSVRSGITVKGIAEAI